MKLYKEISTGEYLTIQEKLVIDGEGDLTLMKSPVAEKGFITAFGIKLSEKIIGEKYTIRNFYHCIVPTDFLGKLKLLYEVIKYIFMKGEINHES